MAELGRAESLTDETRAELDTIETGTPDLERQLRAATVAVDDEDAEQRAAAKAGDKPEGDTEDRERAELRSKVKMSGYVVAACENRSVAGAEAEYNDAIGIQANRFPLETTRATGTPRRPGRTTRGYRCRYCRHAAHVA